MQLWHIFNPDITQNLLTNQRLFWKIFKAVLYKHWNRSIGNRFLSQWIYTFNRSTVIGTDTHKIKTKKKVDKILTSVRARQVWSTHLEKKAICSNSFEKTLCQLKVDYKHIGKKIKEKMGIDHPLVDIFFTFQTLGTLVILEFLSCKIWQFSYKIVL